ncbi:UMP-CMP kinase 3-like isoform X2 [Curcuma longa]|uniref:UMP-CMP kinase 3-like isoform X2 n=2 Tax=Curcuma longa TaxID=136217 RepID=UPI003D9DF568
MFLRRCRSGYLLTDFVIQNIALMETTMNSSMDGNGAFLGDKKITVVFVLGGPGSGKGTQCSKIVENFGFTHLSAGDLLRAEIKSGSENGTMISNMIKEGKIVPSEVTVELLRKAILESGNNKFLIDGFPRNEENRAAFENVTKLEPEFILFFDCSEEEMEQRLLGRNQGRDDDNIETIRKRFRVFIESSLPVVEYYDQKGKVRKIDAMKPIDDVFEDVKAIFAPLLAKDESSCSNDVTNTNILEKAITSAGIVINKDTFFKLDQPAYATTIHVYQSEDQLSLSFSFAGHVLLSITQKDKFIFEVLFCPCCSMHLCMPNNF